MISKFDLSSLSSQELAALEQEILVEESRRIMSSSSVITVEPNASEKSHRDAIARLLEHKSQKS